MAQQMIPRDAGSSGSFFDPAFLSSGMCLDKAVPTQRSEGG